MHIKIENDDNFSSGSSGILSKENFSYQQQSESKPSEFYYKTKCKTNLLQIKKKYFPKYTLK